MLLKKASRISSSCCCCSSFLLLLSFLFLLSVVVVIIGNVEAATHPCPGGSLHLKDQSLGTATFDFLNNCDLLITDCTADKLEFQNAVTSSNITIDGLVCSQRTSSLTAPCVDFQSNVDAGKMNFSRISVDVSSSTGGTLNLIKHAGVVKVNSSYMVQDCSISGQVSSPSSGVRVSLVHFALQVSTSSALTPSSSSYNTEVVLRNNSMRGFTVTGADRFVEVIGFVFNNKIQNFARFILNGLDMSDLDLAGDTNDYVTVRGVAFSNALEMSASSAHRGGIFSVSGIKIGGNIVYVSGTTTPDVKFPYVTSVLFDGSAAISSGMYSLAIQDCSTSLSKLDASGKSSYGTEANVYICYFSEGFSNIDSVVLTDNSLRSPFIESEQGHSVSNLFLVVKAVSNVSSILVSNNLLSTIQRTLAASAKYLVIEIIKFSATISNGNTLRVLNNTISQSTFHSLYVYVRILTLGSAPGYTLIEFSGNSLEGVRITTVASSSSIRAALFWCGTAFSLSGGTLISRSNSMSNFTAVVDGDALVAAFYFETSVTEISNFTVDGLDMMSNNNNNNNLVEGKTLRFHAVLFNAAFSMSSSASSAESGSVLGGVFSVSGIKIGGRVKYTSSSSVGVHVVEFKNTATAGVHSISISDCSVSLSRLEATAALAKVYILHFLISTGITNIYSISVVGNSINGRVSSASDGVRAIIFNVQKFSNVSLLKFSNNNIDVISSCATTTSAAVFSSALASSGSGQEDGGLIFRNNTVSGSYSTSHATEYASVAIMSARPLSLHNFIMSENNRVENVHVSGGRPYIRLHIVHDSLQLLGLSSSTFSSSGDSVRNVTVNSTTTHVQVVGLHVTGSVSGISNFSVSHLDMSSSLNNVESTASYARWFGVFFENTFTMSASSSHQGGIVSVSGVKIGGTVKYADKDSTSYGVSAVNFVGEPSGIHSLSVSDCSISLSNLEASGSPVRALASILHLMSSTGISNINLISVTGNSITGNYSSASDAVEIMFLRFYKFNNISRITCSNNKLDGFTAQGGGSAGSVLAHVLYSRTSSSGSGKQQSGIVIKNNILSGGYFSTGTTASIGVSVTLVSLPETSSHNFLLSENNKFENVHVVSTCPVYLRMHGIASFELLGLPSSTISSRGDVMRNITVNTTSTCNVNLFYFFFTVSKVSNFSVVDFDASDSRNNLDVTGSFLFIPLLFFNTFNMSSPGTFSVSGVKMGGAVSYFTSSTLAGAFLILFGNTFTGPDSFSVFKVTDCLINFSSYTIRSNTPANNRIVVFTAVNNVSSFVITNNAISLNHLVCANQATISIVDFTKAEIIGSGASDSIINISSNSLKAANVTSTGSSVQVYIAQFHPSAQVSNYDKLIFNGNSVSESSVTSTNSSVECFIVYFRESVTFPVSSPTSGLWMINNVMNNLTLSSKEESNVFGLRMVGPVSSLLYPAIIKVSSFTMSPITVSSQANVVLSVFRSADIVMSHAGRMIFSDIFIGGSSSSSSGVTSSISAAGPNSNGFTGLVLNPIRLTGTTMSGIDTIEVRNCSIDSITASTSNDGVFLLSSVIFFRSPLQNVVTLTVANCSITGGSFNTSGTSSEIAIRLVHFGDTVSNVSRLTVTNNVIGKFSALGAAAGRTLIAILYVSSGGISGSAVWNNDALVVTANSITGTSSTTWFGYSSICVAVLWYNESATATNYEIITNTSNSVNYGSSSSLYTSRIYNSLHSVLAKCGDSKFKATPTKTISVTRSRTPTGTATETITTSRTVTRSRPPTPTLAVNVSRSSTPTHFSRSVSVSRERTITVAHNKSVTLTHVKTRTLVHVKSRTVTLGHVKSQTATRARTATVPVTKTLLLSNDNVSGKTRTKTLSPARTRTHTATNRSRTRTLARSFTAIIDAEEPPRRKLEKSVAEEPVSTTVQVVAVLSGTPSSFLLARRGIDAGTVGKCSPVVENETDSTGPVEVTALAPSDSPLQLEFGSRSDNLATHRGAALGNLIFCGGFLLIYTTGALAYAVWTFREEDMKKRFKEEKQKRREVRRKKREAAAERRRLKMQKEHEERQKNAASSSRSSSSSTRKKKQQEQEEAEIAQAAQKDEKETPLLSESKNEEEKNEKESEKQKEQTQWDRYRKSLINARVPGIVWPLYACLFPGTTAAAVIMLFNPPLSGLSVAAVVVSIICFSLAPIVLFAYFVYKFHGQEEKYLRKKGEDEIAAEEFMSAVPDGVTTGGEESSSSADFGSSSADFGSGGLQSQEAQVFVPRKQKGARKLLKQQREQEQQQEREGEGEEDEQDTSTLQGQLKSGARASARLVGASARFVGTHALKGARFVGDQALKAAELSKKAAAVVADKSTWPIRKLWNFFTNQNYEWTDSAMVKSLGLCFDAYRSMWFALAEMTVAVAFSSLSATATMCSSRTCCYSCSAGALIVALFFLIASFVTKPYLALFEKTIGLSSTITIMVTTILNLLKTTDTATGLHADRIDVVLDICAQFILALGLAASCKAIGDISVSLYDYTKKDKKEDDSDDDSSESESESDSDNNNNNNNNLSNQKNNVTASSSSSPLSPPNVARKQRVSLRDLQQQKDGGGDNNEEAESFLSPAMRKRLTMRRKLEEAEKAEEGEEMTFAPAFDASNAVSPRKRKMSFKNIPGNETRKERIARIIAEV